MKVMIYELYCVREKLTVSDNPSKDPSVPSKNPTAAPSKDVSPPFSGPTTAPSKDNSSPTTARSKFCNFCKRVCVSAEPFSSAVNQGLISILVYNACNVPTFLGKVCIAPFLSSYVLKLVIASVHCSCIVSVMDAPSSICACQVESNP